MHLFSDVLIDLTPFPGLPPSHACTGACEVGRPGNDYGR